MEEKMENYSIFDSVGNCIINESALFTLRVRARNASRSAAATAAAACAAVADCARVICMCGCIDETILCVCVRVFV